MAFAADGLRLVPVADAFRWAFFFFSAGVAWHLQPLREGSLPAGRADRATPVVRGFAFTAAAIAAGAFAQSQGQAMKRLDVRGKSRAEIADLLRRVRRDRIYELVHELVTIEEHFTPDEIARARRMTKSAVVGLCKNGKIPGAHKPMDNGWRISQRGLEAWDDSTCVNPLPARDIPPAGFVSDSGD